MTSALLPGHAGRETRGYLLGRRAKLRRQHGPGVLRRLQEAGLVADDIYPVTEGG